ncbi:D-psicose 3-epimerase [Commensalibacter oyaizuii]|uniref:Sugar phosphate isomerase/epimerase n=1 Tax=Commensalibacter oyaizuii TaxID=3043873 RepID=A0ABT6PZP4_9PROT|nr:sugar phosphate isomerase/epimerase [Commensalibacter sp. TBRC 16381]MDI2090328.1 sugar phosphate isomerase/epimerase [Commensalibacter sp. TBRC 16381]
MQFGTLYSYWNKEWDCNTADYLKLIEKISSIGFDILEINADHVYHMPESDLKKLNDLRNQHGLKFTLNSGPSKEYDMASDNKVIRQQAIQYYTKILEKMPLLKANTLIGAIYSYWPCDFTSTNKELAWKNSIACLRHLGQIAEDLNITIALEVLNRNETYILTNCQEAVDYCKQINSKSVKILLDTYHMNIEEDSIPDAIRYAGDWLAHLHVGENNRKLPGMNNTIDWPAVAAALHDIGYDKGVVMEPFILNGGSVGNAIRVWRDLSNNATPQQMDNYIIQSLNFLRKTFAIKN